MRWSGLLLAACMGPLSAANIDGTLDASFADGGRSLFGFMESDQTRVRAIVKGEQGSIWMFAEDRDDPAAVYMVKTTANGNPDVAFGPANDGRRRIVLPAALIPQAEAIDIDGAIIQADGKPIFFGGLRAIGNNTGAFPAFACRLTASGTLDGGYGTAGCRTVRAFIANDERCRATDAALTPDAKLVMVGNCIANNQPERPFLTRLNAAGGFDTEFAGGAGLVTPTAPLASIQSQHLESVVVRPNGLIAVLGEYMMFSNNVVDLELGVTQFDGGGSIDSGFASNGFRSFAFDLGGDNADRARDLALRADGRLLALGEATLGQPPQTRALLAGLLANGQIDPAVGPAGRRVEDFSGSLGLESRLATLEFDDRDRAVIAARRVDGLPDALIHTGTDFWVPVMRAIAPEHVFRLVISADTATSGLVSNAAQGVSIPFTVAAGASTALELSPHLIGIATADSVQALGFHVTTLAPVSVVVVAGRTFSIDSYIITPTPQLGREFRVMAWGAGPGAGTQTTIAAAFNNTQLWITPSITIGARPAGVPYTITLQQGQSYHLFGAVQNTDMTGTRVSSNRPVQVIAGHSCGQVPVGTGLCDIMFDTQAPIDTWGTQFVAVPDPTLPAGHSVRVLAHESDTRVWFDGVSQAVLAAGQTFSAIRTTPTVITTSKPAAAASLALGCENHLLPTCPGDPSLAMLPPTSQWGLRQHVVVTGPISTYETIERVTLVVPADAVAGIFFDDVQIPEAAFTPTADGSFRTTSFLSTVGFHLLRAARPVMAQVNNIANAEGLAHGIVHAPQLSVGNETGTANDVLLRLTPTLARDPTFGINGVIVIDHTGYLGSANPSRDEIVRAIPDGAGILVASAVRNNDSGQDLLMAYRVAAGSLFRNGFED